MELTRSLTSSRASPFTEFFCLNSLRSMLYASSLVLYALRFFPCALCPALCAQAALHFTLNALPLLTPHASHLTSLCVKKLYCLAIL
jgi:hypothetical protein